MTNIVIKLAPRSSLTVSYSASDLMTGCPHHLSIMTDIFKIIPRITVGEVLIFKVPRLQSEKPETIGKDINICIC